MHLKKGTLLKHGDYRIESVLGQGGFGITYLADQTGLNRKVAIKEFFMSDFCERDPETSHVSLGTSGSRETVEKFKAKFIKEAQTIARLDNPHIIRIHDVFEENDTAYYVMEYIDGQSLKDVLPSGKALTEAVALNYIRQVSEALSEVHANGLLHLDIKPGNIMVDFKGRAVLIDFGVSKRFDNGGGSENLTTTTTLPYTPGYAPLEQMDQDGSELTPASDIYALGATLYRLLSGETPPAATALARRKHLEPLPESVSPSVRNAVNKAMQIDEEKRPQTVADFLALLDASSSSVGKNGEETASAVKVDESTVFPDDKDSKVASVFTDSRGNKTFTVNGVSFKMIAVNGGTFRMGRKSFLSLSDESPVHDVTLSDYYIGETEVTQELWQAVMGSNPSLCTGDFQRPVEFVCWDECQTFIGKLNELTGGSFRLPTEAEWEYAARGGQKSRGYKYSGSDNIGDVAWYDEDFSSGSTHPVKTKSPNELGIYDMSGNVAEWCQDWYGDYSSASQTNPKGPSSGFDRVIRGGDYYSDATVCRCTARSFFTPEIPEFGLGLRLVSQ